MLYLLLLRTHAVFCVVVLTFFSPAFSGICIFSAAAKRSDFAESFSLSVTLSLIVIFASFVNTDLTIAVDDCFIAILAADVAALSFVSDATSFVNLPF